MQPNSIKTAFLISAGLVTLRSSFGEDASRPLERYLTEAPSAHAALRQQFTDGTIVTMREEVRVEKNGSLEALARRNALYTIRRPSLVVEEDSDEEGLLKGGTYILAANSKYGFRLERERSGLPWLIRDVETDDPRFLLYKNTDAIEARSWSIEEILLLDLIPVLEIGGVPLDRLLSSQGTSILGARVDGERIAIEFSVQPDTDRVYRLAGGTVWLLPQRFWAIGEFEVQDEIVFPSKPAEKRISHRKIEWSDLDGVSVPIGFAWNCRNLQDGRIMAEGRREYLNWQLNKKLPEKRFTLSHYNLPDPVASSTVASGKNVFSNSILLINLVGAVLIALGLIIRKIYRNRSISPH